MDIQLKELLETIKKDGVASAEAKAAEIIAQAEKQAEAMRAKAQAEAERLLQEAKREIARSEQASKDGLVQAGRDLLLGLERRIVQLFDKVIKGSVSEALSGEGLLQILTALVTAWVQKNNADIEVLLSPKDYAALEKGLQAKLAQELKKGVVIKPVATVESGFRIGEKNGSAYYDFTVEGLAEILSANLSPKLAEILKIASKVEG